MQVRRRQLFVSLTVRPPRITQHRGWTGRRDRCPATTDRRGPRRGESVAQPLKGSAASRGCHRPRARGAGAASSVGEAGGEAISRPG
jgi:hypothetical protein